MSRFDDKMDRLIESERRDFERWKRAGGVSAAVAALLTWIACWAATRNTAGDFPSTLFVGLVGLIVGLRAADKASLRRANLTGTFMFGALGIGAALLTWVGIFDLKRLNVLADYLWYLAAAVALGSICAQVAWVLGGSSRDESGQPRPRQFTLRQLLAFFIPVAVYFGYVRYLLQR